MHAGREQMLVVSKCSSTQKDIFISLKNVGHAEEDFFVPRRKKIFTIMKRKSTFEFISFFVIRNIISVEAKQPFKLKTPASNDL